LQCRTTDKGFFKSMHIHLYKYIPSISDFYTSEHRLTNFLRLTNYKIISGSHTVRQSQPGNSGGQAAYNNKGVYIDNIYRLSTFIMHVGEELQRGRRIFNKKAD